MSEELFRKYEEELDQHYKNFHIYNLNDNSKLYALLASYDSMLLPYLLDQGALEKSPGATLQFKTLDDSLSYCLRWLCEKKPKNLESTSNNKIIELADEILSFGTNYTDISDMHMMYGRNLVEIEINKHQRKIKFKIKDEDSDKKEIHSFLETYEFHKIIGKKNKQKNLKLAQQCMQDIPNIKTELKEGRIILSDISQINHSQFKSLIENEVNTEIIPIKNSADLSGFSFGEYKKYWSAMSNWSNCLLLLFLFNIKRGIDQSKCMPTQLLEEKEFILNIKILSGLKEETITRIVNRLTYDFKNKKAEILLQPFIKLKNRILWSPLIIRKSRHERNILKLMSRNPRLKKISDNIIGERERSFLNLIGNLLSKKSGYQFKLNTNISNQELTAEMDILAYKSNASTEVLVIEGKTILTVDETNEISDATGKLINAQQQIGKAIGILQSLDKEKKKELFKFVNWDKVSNYYPIIMTPDSHPNTLYNDDIVPHISYTSLITFGKKGDFSRPSRIHRFCKEKEWIKEKTPEKSYGHKDIKIGDITYSLPYIKIKR